MTKASIAANGASAALDRRLRQGALVAAVALLGYLALAAAGDAAAFLDGLRRLDGWQWLSLLGLSLLNYGLRFLRWHGYLGALGARVPFRRDLGIYFAGFAFTVTPAKAGEAVRSIYLRGVGVPWSQGLAALMVERLLDLAAVVMLATLALHAYADYAAPALAAVALVAAMLFLVTRSRVLHGLLDRLPAQGRIGRLAQGAVATLDDARVLLAPGRLWSGLLLSVVAWGAEAWGFHLLLQWLGVGLDPLLAAGIYAASILLGALSFLPGGLGGAEAAMVALLLASGVGLGVAVLATVICRAVTLWFAVALGTLAALFAVRS
jgi:uncharacterized membrane protein YbhN (UPF0104 family)